MAVPLFFLYNKSISNIFSSSSNSRCSEYKRGMFLKISSFTRTLTIYETFRHRRACPHSLRTCTVHGIRQWQGTETRDPGDVRCPRPPREPSRLFNGHTCGTAIPPITQLSCMRQHYLKLCELCHCCCWYKISSHLYINVDLAVNPTAHGVYFCSPRRFSIITYYTTSLIEFSSHLLKISLLLLNLLELIT